MGKSFEELSMEYSYSAIRNRIAEKIYVDALSTFKGKAEERGSFKKLLEELADLAFLVGDVFATRLMKETDKDMGE